MVSCVIISFIYYNIIIIEIKYPVNVMHLTYPETIVPLTSFMGEISPGISLEGMMLKLKLQYFGHLM